ncbi:MAG: diphthamide biosynthesis enzyme Dph2 [Candidatus Aenigmarchaeota archaeon]|nr:diphthamide biosynthesis enzyme Dph2 [Candidatus Aenigmarchaeota archaeon]
MNDLAEHILGRGARKVMLQMPEGLKSRAAAIAGMLEKEGIETLISAEACYGACDLRDHEAKAAGCDLLVHIGHSKFYVDSATEVPVLYYPYHVPYRFDGIDFSPIPEKRIGLVTTIQHLPLLKDVKQLLEKQGREAVVGGQILGCWFVNAEKIEEKVDAFLFVGSGKFHPLGMETKKPVYTYDLETHELEKIDLVTAKKRKYAMIYMCKDAKTFGVIVSSKTGQHELQGRAEKIVSYLKEKDKRAFIIVMDEITDNKLLALRLDAYVNTACPRLMDDHFTKPLINAEDVPKIFDEDFIDFEGAMNRERIEAEKEI